MSIAALVIALVATACGSAADSTVIADASSTGVAREFCASVANLGSTATSSPSGVQLVNASSAARELLPDDAPDLAGAYLDAVTESALASTEPSSGWASAQHLQFAAYLGQQCPSPEFTEDPSFLGVIDIGLGSANGASGSGSSDEANAGEPDETTSSTTIVTAPEPVAPPVTAAPGEGPSTTTELVTTNPSAEYKQVRLTVAGAFSTNAEQGEIFDDFSLASKESWVIIEVDAQALANINADFEDEGFLLSTPEGRTTLADRLTDRLGELQYRIDLDGRESKRAFLHFATDGLVSDLTGWEILIEIDNEIPQVLPLTGAAADNPYPIALDPADITGVTGGSNIWDDGAGCISQYQVDLIEADVDIEVRNTDARARADLGTRIIRVEASVRNVTSTDQEFSSCDIGSNGGFESSSLRLVVDGQPISPFEDEGPGSIEVGTTSKLEWYYVIDNTASTIEMVGDEDSNVLGAWTIELPTLPGE